MTGKAGKPGVEMILKQGQPRIGSLDFLRDVVMVQATHGALVAEVAIFARLATHMRAGALRKQQGEKPGNKDQSGHPEDFSKLNFPDSHDAW